MTQEKKTELLNALNEYFSNEEWCELTMEDLDVCIREGSIGVGATTEKDGYHETQAEYNFKKEQFEYFVDEELIETEPYSLDDFIEVISGADFCEIMYPCTRYVNLMYEPLEDRAHEILGLGRHEYVEVYPDGDGDGYEYIVIVWKYNDNSRREYRVNDIEELSTAETIR